MKGIDPLVTDVECYRNFFLVGFRNVRTGNIKTIKLFGEHASLSDEDKRFLRAVMNKHRVITFNGRNYDLPMIYYAMTGATCSQLKDCSDRIIVGHMKFWHLEKELRFKIPREDKIDHIDLIDVAFGKASLKIYGGRIHSKTLWDLPFSPDKILTREDAETLEAYWGNDIVTTVDLYKELEAELDLRAKMSEEYGIDLRSKSDAQIAEAILKQRLTEITGVVPSRPGDRAGDWFSYQPPSWVRFELPQLQSMLDRLVKSRFVINKDGYVNLPESLEGASVDVGMGRYRIGIGGLHSSEECVAHHSDDMYQLIDRDVTSYYPSIILSLGLYPRHLSEDFLNVYRKIYHDRLAAKKAGEKVTAETLKIVLNGSFGKFGSKWSILYSPELLLQVTLTGQLALLMLIERLEMNRTGTSPVVSANTDGIVFRVRRPDMGVTNKIIDLWEKDTGFKTEETTYRSLYSRDVNNYIAVKDDGSVKTKGTYAPDGIRKNPSAPICNDAVIAYLTNRTPIEETIRTCSDVRKFVTIRKVTGGGVTSDGEYLGKAVRWYYADQSDEWVAKSCIRSIESGDQVADSGGARALMTLPDNNALPDDLDFQHYIDRAYSMLIDLGLSEEKVYGYGKHNQET